MLELVNETQLLAWPEFRQAVTKGKAVDEEEYLDKASRSFATKTFVRRWVPQMISHKQGKGMAH